MEKKKMIKEVIKNYAYSMPPDILVNSKYLPEIFDKITTKKELEILLCLPNNSASVAKKLKLTKKEADKILYDLYMRGLIWVEKNTEDDPVYCFTDIGLLMDMILFDKKYKKYGEKFYDLWKNLANEEFFKYSPAEAFRVIPVDESFSKDEIIGETQIVPYETASGIVKNARRIAIANCPCRTRERRCDNPLETCISIDNMADYVVFRKIGREITLEEALEILRDCEERGLIHQTVNSDTPDVICNCCSCCCSILKPLYEHDIKVTVKSRYMAIFDNEKCRSCKDLTCVDKCKFEGISKKDGKLIINSKNCHGCGLCLTACPYDAVTMKEARKLNSIPSNDLQFFPYGKLIKSSQ